MAGELRSDAPGRHRPLRLLVDEYHQFPRSDSFSQGFSLTQDEQDVTYFYATDATGHVNGLFMLKQIIRPYFDVRISRDPIGPDLSQRADAYMIICPPKPAGDVPKLTPADADHLETFVANGGILILVYNTVFSPETDTFDFEGMNCLAQRFGLAFLPTATRTLMIPIARDHPVLFGTRGIIYGAGCTIDIREQSNTKTTVLLESSDPDVPGPIAVRARHKQGTVLAFGDAGTLGNAHAVREDVGQARAVRQLFHCLRPDGPLPAYGWKENMNIAVRLRHELAISGSPKGMRLLDLPLDPAGKSLTITFRELDLQAARDDDSNEPTEEESASKPEEATYRLARASWDLQARLEIGKYDGRAFSARWVGPDTAELACRLTPRGEVLDASLDAGGLGNWRWALMNEIIVAPLDAAAQPGDDWDSAVMTPLPNAQLRPAPNPRQATGLFRFEGREQCRGRPCYVITKTVSLPLDDLRPQDLVNPEHADYFDPTKVRLRNAGQTCVTRTWIDEITKLPVRTELRGTTPFWWTDSREEDSFISDHDHRILEDHKETRRAAIMGRLLIADFE